MQMGLTRTRSRAASRAAPAAPVILCSLLMLNAPSSSKRQGPGKPVRFVGIGASPSSALAGLPVRAPCLNRLGPGPGCLRWLRPGLSAGVLP